MSKLEDRKQELINAAECHIKLGKQLQAEGLKIIKKIPEQYQDATPESLAKLLDSAQRLIVQGCKIEEGARKAIVENSR